MRRGASRRREGVKVHLMSRVRGCRNSKIGLKGKVFQVKGAGCLGNLTNYNSTTANYSALGAKFGRIFTPKHKPSVHLRCKSAVQVLGFCWSGTYPTRPNCTYRQSRPGRTSLYLQSHIPAGSLNCDKTNTSNHNTHTYAHIASAVVLVMNLLCTDTHLNHHT